LIKVHRKKKHATNKAPPIIITKMRKIHKATRFGAVCMVTLSDQPEYPHEFFAFMRKMIGMRSLISETVKSACFRSMRRVCNGSAPFFHSMMKLSILVPPLYLLLSLGH
jgi:hypothetical protein